MNDRVANSVREHRKNAGLTQEDLAAAMSVSRQYVPSLPLALKLARYFNCSTDDVFTIEEGG
jgi:putative transcriptional regulator